MHTKGKNHNYHRAAPTAPACSRPGLPVHGEGSLEIHSQGLGGPRNPGPSSSPTCQEPLYPQAHAQGCRGRQQALETFLSLTLDRGGCSFAELPSWCAGGERRWVNRQ